MQVVADDFGGEVLRGDQPEPMPEQHEAEDAYLPYQPGVERGYGRCAQFGAGDERARLETWRTGWARCSRWAKNSSSSAWILLCMPLRSDASSAGRGSLRSRVNVLGKPACRAKSRYWLKCRYSEKARSSCSNMAANRQKGLYWPQPCLRKKPRKRGGGLAKRVLCQALWRLILREIGMLMSGGLGGSGTWRCCCVWGGRFDRLCTFTTQLSDLNEHNRR